MNTRKTLATTIAAFDAKQTNRKGFNPYALPQYLRRLDEVMADIDLGADPRAAIVAGFTGQLAAALLRAIGAAPYQRADAVGQSWAYRPVNNQA